MLLNIFLNKNLEKSCSVNTKLYEKSTAHDDKMEVSKRLQNIIKSEDMAESSRPKHPALSNVICTLETKELWNKFDDLGTEMIITKSGRYTNIGHFFHALKIGYCYNLIIFTI